MPVLNPKNTLPSLAHCQPGVCVLSCRMPDMFCMSGGLCGCAVEAATSDARAIAAAAVIRLPMTDPRLPPRLNGSRQREGRRLASANEDSTVEVWRVEAVVVVITGPDHRERVRLAALPRREKSDGVDLEAIPVLGVGSPLHVMGHAVVVGKVTRPPAAIVASRGFIPVDVITMVPVDGGAGEGSAVGSGCTPAAGGGGCAADGIVPPYEPQAAQASAKQTITDAENGFPAR